ncbi:lipoyl synthase [Clostridium sporogenes]|uniref:Lipoyl synthase n=2 Tax=Clostridium TaxID=1485 RepID=A0AAE4Z4V1_CLOSG|nr:MULTISPECIES: lipoyl synthase [Clostridium]MBE6076484.1 lipoyl synthase [Clostridium lundense]MDU2833362.1 lipoyl synthase [Clostridium botulinum]EDU37446.1 lipoyl synthase [Clostridium sporogenes ATCC 15579]KIS23348.1 lipoyl synthase [Clostridium botulinum B2 450]MCW6094913.1 lipoyl synthase [Clostridium sporogenes]
MYKRKPEWLKIKFQFGDSTKKINALKRSLGLNTVCDEANCPNRLECHNKGTATFMILGSVCTRNCRFCNVKTGKAQCVDKEEPLHVAQAVKELGLKHAVITSVTRDDLEDGGASQFAEVIRAIRKLTPNTTIEVLIPDLKGNWEALKVILDEKPEILNHNIETISGLYKKVRPEAIYTRSLELLRKVKEIDKNILTKSGFMVGLGEKEEEVIELLKDLRKYQCDIVTIGQYLQPSKEHIELEEYVHPEVFKKYKKIGLDMGFKYIASSPLVRSSYNAAEALK